MTYLAFYTALQHDMVHQVTTLKGYMSRRLLYSESGHWWRSHEQTCSPEYVFPSPTSMNTFTCSESTTTSRDIWMCVYPGGLLSADRRRQELFGKLSLPHETLRVPRKGYNGTHLCSCKSKKGVVLAFNFVFNTWNTFISRSILENDRQ